MPEKNKAAALGIDLGGTDIKFGVLLNGEIIDKEKHPTLKGVSEGEMVDYIADISGKLIKKHNIVKVGLSTAGSIIDGRVSAVNLPFNKTPLASLLEEKLNLPVKMENDASCAAYGDAVLGTGKDFTNTILLSLGTGVGGGIIINKEIYRGKGDAGELGHIIIQKNGAKCGCGQEGCLEKYASVTALCLMAEEGAIKDKASVLYTLYRENGYEMNGKIVFAAIEKNCPVAKNVLECYTSYLAAGIESIIRVFSPDAVILAGGITREGDKLLNPIKEKVKLDTPILISSLYNDAGIVGAALL